MRKRYEKYKDSGIEWIGEVPEHWDLRRLKAVLIERKELNIPVKTDFILSLTINRGVIPYTEKGDIGNKSKEDLTKYKLAYPDDIVLNSMNVIVGSVGLSRYFGAVSPVYYTLYLRNQKDFIQYFNSIFQSNVFQKSLIGFGNGIMIKETDSGNFNTIRMRIPMIKLNTVLLPYPEAKEQKAIANYLDQKTSEIDSLIADKEKLIQRLQEYKQSVITEAVTKGLDPDVKMKDSGIEWIGEIPEHWDTVKLKYVVELINKKSNEKDLPYIGLEHIESWTGKYIEGKSQPEVDANKFDSGNILFGKLRPYLAKVFMPDFYGRCTSELLVLKPTSIIPRFLFYSVLSKHFIDAVDSSTYGAKMPRASWSFISSLPILAPPAHEQKEIAKQLHCKIEKIDVLILKITDFIQKLKEYRQSLIYEAVTGKIDVRDYKPENYEFERSESLA